VCLLLIMFIAYVQELCFISRTFHFPGLVPGNFTHIIQDLPGGAETMKPTDPSSPVGAAYMSL